jgi:hypothetical protein
MMRGCRVYDRMVDGFTITTKVVGLNPAHGEVYSIQHYVIKCVSDRHHITETLFKVEVNTVTLVMICAWDWIQSN